MLGTEILNNIWMNFVLHILVVKGHSILFAPSDSLKVFALHPYIRTIFSTLGSICPEDGGNMLLRNVGNDLPGYTASHRRIHLS
jgi:hypothetical protein